MYIIIAGGGKVGSYLARDFSERNHAVILIERRLDRAEKIAANLPSVLIIHGDACDARYLEDAKIEKADVIVAVTGDDDDNLVVCQLAKESYGVPRAVARVNNPKNEAIFNALGVDAAISATSIIAKIVEEEVAVGDVIALQVLKQGKLALVEVDVGSGSGADGCRISDLGLPRDAVLVAIARDDDLIIPRGSTTLAAGDTVFALTSPEREAKLSELFKRKGPPETCDL